MTLVVLATQLLSAQQPRPEPPRPPQNEREPTGVQDQAVNDGGTWPTPRRSRPDWPLVTPARQLPPAVAELKQNVQQIQAVNDRLQELAASGGASNYRAIESSASQIQEIATRLQSRLELSATGGQAVPENNLLTAAEQLAHLITALDESIKDFVRNPVAQQPHTVDAQLLGEAGRDLERIIRQSASARQLAGDLNNKTSSTSRSSSPGNAGNQKAGKRRPDFQITLDCEAWTVEGFSGRVAKIENAGSTIIERVKVQVKLHKLSTEQLFFLEECMLYRSGDWPDEERYAAAVKEFLSFEVKGKPFAYRVTYSIVRTRNNKITARLAQPISLYYTDESGQGAFELYRGGMPLRFLPDWAKNLASQR